MAEFRVAVLASGDGSNLQALIDEIHRPGIAKIVLVTSDNPGARALARAKDTGIPAQSLPPQPGEGRRAYHARLAELVRVCRPDLVVLAGYMRLLPKAFVQEFAPIINVHPSLLPAFPGLDAPGQALAQGVKVSGCTVHLVDEGMDTGPILIQEPELVLPGDTPELLHKRIKVLEHRALVRAVAAFAQGKVQKAGSNLMIEEETDASKASLTQRV